MSISPQLMTAEELLHRGDLGRCELIYGEMVKMRLAGVEHGVVAGRIGGHRCAIVEQNDLGLACAAGTGFKVESDPDLVRAPDASFIRKDRLPKRLPKGFFEGVPDLAVEVISPGDKRRDVAEKVNVWLAHGTISCWVADPGTITLTIHRTGRKPIRLTVADQIGDEPALPGFVLPLSRIFQR